MYYRAVGNRCAVHVPSLGLPASYEEVESVLIGLGFRILDVDAVSMARSLVGKSQYRLGAEIDEAPDIVDCSSLIKYLYAQRGVWVPRLSIQQRAEGMRVDQVSGGDLVFTTGCQNYYETDSNDAVGHVGIATGAGTVIHAHGKSRGVIESPYTEFVGKDPRSFRRVVVEGTVTLEIPRSVRRRIETSDDLRWLLLKIFK